MNDCIYIVGGRNTATPSRFDSFQMYDPRLATWTELPGLPHGRYNVCAAVDAPFIYVLGGYDDREVLNTVERFDTKALTWTTCAAMIQHRSLFAVAIGPCPQAFAV